MTINDNVDLNVSLSVSGDFLQVKIRPFSAKNVSWQNQMRRNEKTLIQFNKEVVALEIDENKSDSSRITKLGHITNRIVCTPEF